MNLTDPHDLLLVCGGLVTLVATGILMFFRPK